MSLAGGGCDDDDVDDEDVVRTALEESLSFVCSLSVSFGEENHSFGHRHTTAVAEGYASR